jgi:hypothetical protein
VNFVFTSALSWFKSSSFDNTSSSGIIKLEEDADERGGNSDDTQNGAVRTQDVVSN